MKRNMLSLAVLLVAVLAMGTWQLAAKTHPGNNDIPNLSQEVRHQLITLPWYGVFDNLTYQVDGNKVILSGQVTRPVLKADAERSVKRVEGVEVVENNIEVLPLSPMDDQIRTAVYRKIFGNVTLFDYAVRAVSPIHIIVKNGNVSLEGVIARESDKIIAGMEANSVSGVFSVTNHLAVEWP